MDSTSTHHQSNQSNNSGLLRFRSAPSSLLADFMNSNAGDGGSAGSGMEDKSRAEAAGEAVNFSGLLPPQYPRHSSAMDTSSYDLLGMNRTSQGKPVTSSGLMRQTSSPPGLFTNLSVQNGYSSMKGLGNYCGVNGMNGELRPSSTRLKNQISFSSGQPSSLSLLSQISEIDEESIGANSYDGGAKLGNSFGNEYQCGYWNGSSQFTVSLSGMKKSRDDEHKFFGHFQESVPCKIRAKRGCATHPRSIAERLRRTRISERMRKLQEFVPNMDKQTNTADMLDLAVEYIKDLQKQFKSFRDKRAKCKCLNAQKAVPNQIV